MQKNTNKKVLFVMHNKQNVINFKSFLENKEMYGFEYDVVYSSDYDKEKYLDFHLIDDVHSKKDCKVLDFAGNIQTHGPITNVSPPKKKGDKKGDPPIKVCEECQEIVHLSVMICPSCGKPFPEPQKQKIKLSDLDIMGLDNNLVLDVNKWKWRKYTSKKTNKEMLLVTYYGKSLNSEPVKQYFTIYHEGRAGDIARRKLFDILAKAGVVCSSMNGDPSAISRLANLGTPPKSIVYQKKGRFHNVTKTLF